MITLVFSVEGEPKGKGRPRFSKVGGFVKTYTDQKTRDYESLISKAARTAMGETPPMEGALHMSLLICCSIPKTWSKKKRLQALHGELYPTTKPDLDNICKIVADSMNGIVYTDDKQIISLKAIKHYGEAPFISICVMGHEQ